tara:strand:- start:1391 stop:1705 length:315 start_codon:yes stop_codon:yes gene_type:complete
LSPRILPPVLVLDGSIASTATLFLSFKISFPNSSMKQLLPTPGTPVTAIRIEFPECGKHFKINCLAISWSSFFVLSTKVIAALKAILSPFLMPLYRDLKSRVFF